MESHDNSSIMPFSFDGASIRVTCDEQGEPWFVAKDVAEALGYSWNGSARIAHVPERWRGVTSVVTPSGVQQMPTLSEHGLYFFLGRSDKPAARTFQEWLAGEVLPSIRRTGRYAVPRAQPVVSRLRVASDQLESIVRSLDLTAEAVRRVPGVRPEIAAAATLHCIEETTGLIVEPLRRALPAHCTPLASMNPTQVGSEIGMTAREANRCLALLGLQFRNARNEWELSECGKKHADALPYANGRHAGYQIRVWLFPGSKESSRIRSLDSSEVTLSRG
jgi:prophage antirepressor-like protein